MEGSQGTIFPLRGPRSGLRGGRSQLVDPSGPGPQTCPAVITEGERSPTQLALRLLKPPKQWRGGRLGPADCYPGDCQLLLGHRDKDGGEVHSCLKAGAQPVGGFHKGSGALRDTAPSLFPGSSSSPADTRPGELEGLGGEGQDSPLT